MKEPTLEQINQAVTFLGIEDGIIRGSVRYILRATFNEAAGSGAYAALVLRHAQKAAELIYKNQIESLESDGTS